MAYCTYDNIQSEFKDVTFSTTTTAVTQTEVTAFISEVEAEIDGRIGVRYTTPIIGTSSLLIMRMVSIFLTCSRISKILEIKTGEADKDQPRRVEEAKAAYKIIDDIIAGKLILTDAVLRSSSNGGVRSYNYSNNIEQSIDVTIDQW
jgi:phage gp36-like protein